MSEEVNEYLESKSENELADIIEVVYRIAELRGIPQTELEKIKGDKIIERGGFSKNYFLTEKYIKKYEIFCNYRYSGLDSSRYLFSDQ